MAKAIVTLAGKGTGKRHDDCKMNINEALMKVRSPLPMHISHGCVQDASPSACSCQQHTQSRFGAGL